jgi:hypothetical protein
MPQIRIPCPAAGTFPNTIRGATNSDVPTTMPIIRLVASHSESSGRLAHGEPALCGTVESSIGVSTKVLAPPIDLDHGQ